MIARAWEDDARIVGQVVEVGPSVLTVLINREAPHGTAFAPDSLSQFPRINGIVVVPTEMGAVLALVVWVGVSDDPTRFKDLTDHVGLPTPRRVLKAMPLGLVRRVLGKDGSLKTQLDRGVLSFPTVGDPVRLPTADESASAVPAATGSDAIPLGVAPLAGNTAVTVSGARLFGRHLAVLGNTGSGKSCSVTHLVRAGARTVNPEYGTYRAVVLDLNGEYGHAFDGLPVSIAVTRLSVGPAQSYPGSTQLRVPFWLWNYREWAAFCDASGKSQAPVLRQALHLLRSSSSRIVPRAAVQIIAARRVLLASRVGTDATVLKQLLFVLDNAREACKALDPAVNAAVATLESSLGRILGARLNPPGSQYAFKFDVRPLSPAEEQEILLAMSDSLRELSIPVGEGDTSSVDTPTPFDARDLVEIMNPIAAGMSGGDVQGWIAPMQDRLSIAMNDARLTDVCGFLPGESLEGWLAAIMGPSASSQITVIDLSLIPANAQHVIASVLGRLILEAHERHRRATRRNAPPTILVVEEAHSLVRRRGESGVDEAGVQMAELCRETYERIAREGRKFGLSLVVSSQRPSELSETLLSQCNSFLVHRLVNPRDQDAVKRMVPDSVGALLSEVSSLPAQVAICIGAASPIPTLVRMETVPPEYRPDSSDPEYVAAWASGMELDIPALVAGWVVPPALGQSSASVSPPSPGWDEAVETSDDYEPDPEEMYAEVRDEYEPDDDEERWGPDPERPPF